MKIEVRGMGMKVTGPLREHANRRLRFAVSRFGPRLLNVDVRLGDINGPRGGIDKRCRVAVGVRTGARIVVEEVDADMYNAISRAADRAGRALARRIGRERATGAGNDGYHAA